MNVLCRDKCGPWPALRLRPGFKVSGGLNIREFLPFPDTVPSPAPSFEPVPCQPGPAETARRISRISREFPGGIYGWGAPNEEDGREKAQKAHEHTFHFCDSCAFSRQFRCCQLPLSQTRSNQVKPICSGSRHRGAGAAAPPPGSLTQPRISSNISP